MAVPAVAPSGEAADAAVIIDILERLLHASRAEWLSSRELRVATGRKRRGRRPEKIQHSLTASHEGVSD